MTILDGFNIKFEKENVVGTIAYYLMDICSFFPLKFVYTH